MQLSHEQLAIIESKGIVNSGAGCSKATTVEYARRRPGQKILYIAFNKSVRVEGEKRFLKAGVSNVKIETATRCHHLLGFDIDERESLYPTAISPKDFHFGNKTETLIGGPKEKKARKERTAPPEEHDLFSPMGLRAAGAH